MTFDAPLSWADALKLITARQVMPTDQGSAALSTLPAEIRKLALFSARTTNSAYLERVREIVQEMIDGKINQATATMKLQEWLRAVGYTPEGGFPGESPVPPASSLIQNLASDARIKLVVETLTRHSQSAAYLQQGMSQSRLYNFPCWEFMRLYFRRVPRGSTDKDNDPGWQERWVRSGGELYDGRMLARKDAVVWKNISDSGIWADGLDSDCDPVVFNTGYGRIERNRKLCIELGVIDADEGVASRRISLLGQMFGDPDKATLGDINAKRSALMDALKGLEEAA